MSCFITESTALAIIRRTVSPMPIGRTPGFLFKPISRQARRDEIDFGSIYEVHILLANRAKELQSSLEAPLKDVHSLLHPCASMPDGPSDPVVCKAADRITPASIHSKNDGVYLLGGLEDAVSMADLTCWMLANKHLPDCRGVRVAWVRVVVKV